MQTRLKHLSRLGVWALIVAESASSFAQTDNSGVDAETVALDDILVVGKRAGLVSAQEIKRDKMEIVDSVVADDINKLPDINVTDALSRITGVQILRDRGEGAGVAIRGLTQMETLLNGREVFTAGSGRTLDFADIPSEMLGGIDVYKTSSANHIEGGVGGTIDLRTHRPFDFEGRQLLGSARVIHGDLVDKEEPQFSTLLSDRWKTESFGEFGALVNFAYQRRAWREDQKSAGNPIARSNIIPGQTVIVPNGTSETTSLGQRERTAGSLVLQWRPSDALELYAEGNYAEFKTLQDSYQINVTPSSSFVAGSPRLFPGTNDLQSISWTNAPLSILSFARDTVDRTQQAAVGGSWNKGALTLKTDLSYTKSFNNLFFSGPVFSGRAAQFNQDLSGQVPTTSVSGTDLLNPANFQYASMAYRTRPFNGELSTARLDGDYQLSSGFIKSVSAGFRYAKRRAGNAPGLIFADAAVTGISAADRPSYIMANPADNFLGGEGGSIGSYRVGNLDSARGAAGLRNAFGITAPIPSAGSPLGIWGISEETQAGYLMSKFEATGFPLDGNIGLRAVQTSESVTGSQSAPSTGAVLPINIDSTDIDYLPSLNLRYQLMKGLYLRGGISKSITRQNFDQLSPSLTLIRNTVTPSLNQGGAGNPQLKPIRSDNFDLAVEKYFNPTTSVYITGFLKQVDGFVSNVSNAEVHDGFTYQVSRPQNDTTATINGFEVGYQQFYDFLPSWLSGFGTQANYTYIDSETPSSILGQKVPLQNLSKHSYNLIGMYEKGPFSARVAYNWRDTFLSGVTNIVGGGALPIYTNSYGWLDASVGYRINEHFSFTIEGMNLLNTLRSSYYGVETRPQSVWVNDTQVGATMTVRL
ncbi:MULTISPECIES: TonB-dependent receptor [Methylobacter]